MADGRIVIDVIMDDGDVKKGVANIDGVAKASDKAGLSLKNMVGAGVLIKGVSAAMGVLKSSVGSAVERFDTLQKFPKVMESLGFNTDQSAKASKRLSDGIDGLPTTLQEVVANTQRMTSITGDLDKSTDATIAMNNAFLASGASTDAASRGMDQYMKMVSTGKVELDSWTTLQETMPLALQKTAEAMGFVGKTAQNDLYSALKSGTVTFDQFQDKLIELGTGTGQLADLAKKNSLGIGTSFKNLGSSITKGLANVLTKFDGIVQKLSGKSIAQNIDSLKGIINKSFTFIISAMDKLIPVMEVVSKGLKGVFKALGTLLAPINNLVKGLGILGSAFVELVANGPGPHIAELREKFLQLLPESVWQKMSNFVDVINQVKAAISGVTGIVTGSVKSLGDLDGVLMGTFGEKGTQNIMNIGNAIKNMISDVKNFVSTAAQSFLGFVSQAVGAFNGVIEAISPIFGTLTSLVVNNLTNAFSLAVSNIRNTITTITWLAETLTPIFSAVFESIKNIVSKFAGVFQNISPQFIGIVGSLTAVWLGFGGNITKIATSIVSGVSKIGPVFSSLSGGVIGAVGKITSVFSSLMSGGLSVSGILSSVGSALGALISPVGLVIAGITALVAGFAYLMATNESFRTQIMGVVATILSSFVPVIKQIGQTIGSIISSVLPVVISLMQQILPVIEQIITVIFQLAAALAPIIANLVSTLLPVIQNIIKAVMNIVTAVAPAIIGVIQMIITIIQALLPIITSIISVVANVVGSVITFIGTVITAIANVIAVVMGIISPIVSFIAMIISNIFSAISPIIAFVSNVFSTVFTVISGVFNNILNFISGIWNTIGGIISGISSVVSQVFNTIASTVSRIMGSVGQTISGVFQGIQNAWNGLTGFVSGVFDGISSAVQVLVNQVKGFVNGVIGGVNAAIGLINKIPGVSIGKIPELRYGTKKWQGGFAMMNEGGRGEIVHLPNGSQVIPHDISAMYAKQAAKESARNAKSFELPKVTAEVALGIGQRMTTGISNVSNYYTTNNSNNDADREEVIEVHVHANLDKKELTKEITEPIRVALNSIERRGNRMRGIRI